MKFRVDINGEVLLLDLIRNGTHSMYALRGELEQSGSASVEEVMPGVFSVLLGDKSLQVHLAPHVRGMEVYAGLQRYIVSLADPRDRPNDRGSAGTAGPMELRAQMPGKIIKLLVEQGSNVTTGQGLIVVEAMKMQNEVKSPKEGVLVSIQVVEGATVSAGDLLAIVE